MSKSKTLQIDRWESSGVRKELKKRLRRSRRRAERSLGEDAGRQNRDFLRGYSG